MIKQLRKVGNSQALILDKPILELLGLKEKGRVQLSVTNGSLVVTPVQPTAADEEQFEECLERVMTSRHKLLKRLSQ
ncbi:MAG: AbrB/MazE/SpoVT family DNA-binding domain-containing protein [Planctomycetales bacterium]